MKIFQGLSLFVGLIVFCHGEYLTPDSKPVVAPKFEDRIEFHAQTVKNYVDGYMNLTAREESLLRINKSELENIYNGISKEFSSYSKLSSIPCIYARDHYKIVSRMLKKLEYMMADQDPLIFMSKSIMKKSVNMCHDGRSPRDYFYDLYNLTVLTEWKGYIMLTKFDDLLNSGKTTECFDGNENETNQDKDYTSLHKNRLLIYNNTFMLLMELIKCIPEYHACDEYHDSTKDLGFSKLPSDLNEKIRHQVLLNNRANHRSVYSLDV